MQSTDSSMAAVHLTRELTAQGMQAGELRRMVLSGSLDHVRRGAYAEVAGDPSAEFRHRQLIAATARLLMPEACLSHLSAAVLHGLPVPSNRLDRVHVTRSRWSGNGRRDRWVHVHGAPLDAESIVIIDGLRSTTRDRTAVDTARLLPFGQALAVTDAVLRQGASQRDLIAVLDGLGRRRGMPVARAAVAFADGRSESAGESLSRAVFLTHHVPSPELQYEIRDGSGRLIGRVDFCWESLRTIGEFDGRVKYGRTLDPGRSAETVIYAEKLREDALRDLGWQVVRWNWTDLATPRLSSIASYVRFGVPPRTENASAWHPAGCRGLAANVPPPSRVPSDFPRTLQGAREAGRCAGGGKVRGRREGAGGGKVRGRREGAGGGSVA